MQLTDSQIEQIVCIGWQGEINQTPKQDFVSPEYVKTADFMIQAHR